MPSARACAHVPAVFVWVCSCGRARSHAHARQLKYQTSYNPLSPSPVFFALFPRLPALPLPLSESDSPPVLPLRSPASREMLLPHMSLALIQSAILAHFCGHAGVGSSAVEWGAREQGEQNQVDTGSRSGGEVGASLDEGRLKFVSISPEV